MNPLFDQLVQSVFQKNSLGECSVQELEQLTSRYPYFGTAQLLLVKKLQAEDPEKFTDQFHKTSLFFQNPLWLDLIINGTGNAEIIEVEKKESFASIVTTESLNISEQKEPEPAIHIPGLKTEPFEAANGGMIFEPYHLVDYFASQGIKFKEEDKPTDKFGQQLKSFTEWLKTMKRLPVLEIVKATGPIEEKKVEQLAEHSLQDREVITETMADVWEKQGNTAKAIAIYNKLSLLDPSKSAYFATKIEELKKLS